MKRLQLEYFIFPLILANVAAAPSQVFEIKNSWNTGFQGLLTIPITEAIEDGWKLEVKFHEQLAGFELWVGKLESAEQGESGSNYIFVNHPYNKQLTRGEDLEAEFTATLTDDSGPRVPPVTIKFQHRVIYSDYYELANDKATVSTTDIAYVINSMTKAPGGKTRKTSTKASGGKTRKTSTKTTTSQPPVLIHDVTISTTEPDYDVIRVSTEKQTTTTVVSLDAKANEDTDTIRLGNAEDDSAEDDFGSGQEIPTPKWKARRTRYPYAKVIHKSLLFYEAQRSGKLPDDNRIPWRGDSAMGDKGKNGEDLTGGYYDGGDHMKFMFPMAFSMTTLSWGLIEYWEAYQQADEVENTLKAIKWGIDYIVKAYVGKYELYGHVGIGDVDHAYWGRAEDMTMDRPAFKITAKNPGSDLAAECSAALSAASLAFERSGIGSYANASYIATLRSKAESLYEFADKYRRRYHKSIKDATKFYPSYSYVDELLWARVWLYRATGDNAHLRSAEGYYHQERMFRMPGSMMFSWDEKGVGIQVLLSQVTGGERRMKYLQRASSYCSRIRRERKRFTKKGLLFMAPWSPLRYAANIAFICHMVGDQGLDTRSNYIFATHQIHYMLGDSGRSYVVGFGKKYPLTPHHRGSSCSAVGCGFSALNSQKPNPHIIHGALVGGPNKRDVYLDNRKDFKTNEVTLDHNSCFQGVVAALLQRSLIGLPRLSRSHEPWYEDFLNYTSAENPPTSTSGVRETSVGHFAVAFAALLLNLFISSCYRH